MITACYLNSEGLREWQKLLHHRTVNIPQFREIWMDTTKLHFAPTVDADAWISPERLQAIREEHRRNDIVRRPGASWQNFEVSLKRLLSLSTARNSIGSRLMSKSRWRFSAGTRRRLRQRTHNLSIALDATTSTSTTRRTTASRTMENSGSQRCMRLRARITSIRI